MTLAKCKHVFMDLYLFICIKYSYTNPVKFSNTAELADGVCEILFNRLKPSYDCLNNHKISTERGNIYIERVNLYASLTSHLNITKGNKTTLLDGKPEGFMQLWERYCVSYWGAGLNFLANSAFRESP